jgi:hypothetical protein
MAEMKTFVIAVTFIVIFSGLLITVPTDFLGTGATPDTPVTPVNPNLLTDFTDHETYTQPNFTLGSYFYTLGSYDWIAGVGLTGEFSLAAKTYFFGIWLGGYRLCKFITEGGTDRGVTISFAEITADAVEGGVRYNLVFEDDGTDAGGFVVYWNSTLYADPEDAWTNNVLYLTHGVGFTTSALNIGSLLLGLLFFQLPDVPFLLNLILATPMWACIIYLIWWFIISMIPFLGGG